MRLLKGMCWLGLIGLLVGATSPAVKPPSEVVTWATTMPAIELSNQPLEKVLNELKQKLPGFDFSISRENVPHEYPVLPKMTLENISLGEFLQLVERELPGVSMSSRVRLADGTLEEENRSFPPNQPQIGVVCYVTVVPNPSVSPSSVKIYGLSEIIAYRVLTPHGDIANEKQATNDILSLIQAALDEVDSPVKPELKIHPQTQTLICKVTDDQALVIEQALKSLRPTTGQAQQLLDELRRLRRSEILAATQPATSPTAK